MTRRLPRWIVDVVETLVLTLVAFFVIQTFVAQPFQVHQTSMESTLEPGQYVLVDKLTPRWSPYQRGDIVVLHPPNGWEEGDDPTPFIKRVIGLPGDQIEIRDDGHVYVNGQALDEDGYTYKDPAGDSQPTTPLSDTSSWTLGSDELFVMGDHRESSADSRAFGPIAVSSVIGRAFLRYWPASTFGILARPAYP
ncbi:MAG TPA: signal peptidase I [Candidatus Limnocylindrales bacterium]